MCMQVRQETMLAAPAEWVWEAMCQPGTMLYVLEGMFRAFRRWPAASTRSGKASEGVDGIMLFHVIPFARWTIEVVKVDPVTRTIVTCEGGGIIRRWNHTLHVEPSPQEECRYVDVINLDAGPFTPAAAAIVAVIFRYRQRLCRSRTRHHLTEAPG